jgi:ComEC/Rec2-related protein
LYRFLKGLFKERVYLGSSLVFTLFISFLSGAVLLIYLKNFVLFFLLACLSAAASFIFFKKGRIVLSDTALIVFFIFLGSCYFSAANNNGPGRFTGAQHLFTLKVATLPFSRPSADSLKARVVSAGGRKVSFMISVLDYSKSMRYGFTYQAPGVISQSYFRGRRFNMLRIKKGAQVSELPLSFLDKVRRRTVIRGLSLFKKNCSPAAYRFLGSVFMGRRELLKDEQELFSRCGISHLLAISGLHIGLVAYVLYFILRIFHIPYRYCLICLLIFLWFYAFITGMSPPTVRAVSMYSVFVISFFARRRLNPLNVLALAGFVILLGNPESIYTLGFQLSFAAVFSLIIGSALFFKIDRGSRILVYTGNIFLCSCLVSIFLLPLISFYFHKVYLLSVLYNVVFIPFFTVIIAGTIVLIIFSWVPGLAASLGLLLSFLVDLFMRSIQFLAYAAPGPLAYRFTLSQVVLYYCFLGAIACFCNRQLRLVNRDNGRKRKFKAEH